MAMAAVSVVGSKWGDKGAVSTQPKLLDLFREALRARHSSVKTTMVCTHLLNRRGKGVCSPVDSMGAAMGSRLRLTARGPRDFMGKPFNT